MNTETTKVETPKTAICSLEVKNGKTPKQARKAIARFSPLKKGGYSKICKDCRCILSKEWTTARADYRKAYHKALQLKAAGKNVRIPNAKTWQVGDVLRYANGTPVKLSTATA